MVIKQQNADYRIFHRIVLKETNVKMHIRALYDDCRFSSEKKYEVIHIPMEHVWDAGDGAGEGNSDEIPDMRIISDIRVVDGTLQFCCRFPGEQEHCITVEEIEGDTKKHIGDFHVYSVDRDLFERMPYKGDLHIHSRYSDGIEPPAYVAAACRRIGLDFMAVTDHFQYLPSVEALEAFKGIRTGFLICHGEEVHPPQSTVHIVNFGGKFSVNELFNKQEYYDDLAAMDKAMEETPADISRRQYLSCVWCFNKIREAGGLGIFCHPFWVYLNRYDVSSRLVSYIFKKQPFDAYELLGGYPLAEINSNTLQVAYYNEMRSQGKKIPVVGASDSHGCETGELFGWYYTIVFSKKLELSEIINSIKDLYSVAVEALPSQTAKVYGPFRLVKYALFLIKYVLPEHDDLCYKQGEWMLRHLDGDRDAADKIAELEEQLLDKFESNWQVESN